MGLFPLTGIPRAAVWLRDGSSGSLSQPGHAVPWPRPTAISTFAFLHGPQDADSAVQHGPVSCRTRKPRTILQGKTAMDYLRSQPKTFWKILVTLALSLCKQLVSLCSKLAVSDFVARRFLLLYFVVDKLLLCERENAGIWYVLLPEWTWKDFVNVAHSKRPFGSVVYRIHKYECCLKTSVFWLVNTL